MKKLLQLEKGETVIKEGDVGETAYMIENGSVEVTRSVDGREIHLATLKAGEIFGEMSMIDDSPRGATVTAAETTTLSELHRDEFLDHLKTEPDFAIGFLRTIFERLRDANVRILQLEGRETGEAKEAVAEAAPPTGERGSAADRPVVVTLEGLTPEAVAALPTNPYRLEHLPFLIGRECPDPLVHNHLNIRDEIPWQISRHHVKLVNRNGRISAIDRGSTLGSIVNGREMGGRLGPPDPVEFGEPEGELILGVQNSPYRFKVQISEE